MFSNYLKNGCTHAQLVELREKLVAQLSEIFKNSDTTK